MADIEQVSSAIGELRAEARNATDQRAMLGRKLDDIAKKLEVLPALAEKVQDHETHIEDYKRLKQRGFGILAGVSLGSAGLSALISNFFGKH